jgi:hypothetical protein
MKFELKVKKTNYCAGRYFLGKYNENLYQLIYDKDRGYAILNVEEGSIVSEFEETIEDLVINTTIGEMIPLKQTTKAEFEPTNEQ